MITLFGTLLLFAGVLLLRNPDSIFAFLRNNVENSAIQVSAVLVRVIIGALLISQSSLSRFPITIEVIGWIFIIAGIFLAIIGRKRFRQLLSWVLTDLKPLGRLAGVMAIAFGGFLVYAFL